MQNGDRYVGKVVSLNTNTLVLQSDVLGTVHLPRGQVALITLGAAAVTNSARGTTAANGLMRARSAAGTNVSPELAASLRQLGANTNLIQQVQAQFLGGAGDEANKKFTEMLSALGSGKMTVNDLRTEAKSAADQLRALKREMGDDAGPTLDGYLTILDGFLKETEATESGAAAGTGAQQK